MLPLSALYKGQSKLLVVRHDGVVADAGAVDDKSLIMPGSFAPLHRGHTELLEIARNQLDCKGYFELSIRNASKPPITPDELERRIAQFKGTHDVIVTSEPLILDKARLLPRRRVLLGIDTLERFLDPAYYANDEQARDLALKEFIKLGSTLVVAGRQYDDGTFRNYSDLKLPDPVRQALSGIIVEIPEQKFRVDISSSKLNGRKTV